MGVLLSLSSLSLSPSVLEKIKARPKTTPMVNFLPAECIQHDALPVYLSEQPSDCVRKNFGMFPNDVTCTEFEMQHIT